MNFIKSMLVILLFSCGFVHAADMDQFRSMPIKDQCDWQVRQFLGAVDSRESGHKRQIFGITNEELREKIDSGEIPTDEHGRVTMPTDGMFVQNYNTLDQEARDFIAKILYLGWDMADEWINASIAQETAAKPEWDGKLNALIHPQTKLDWGRGYYNECLRKKGEERRI